MEGFLHKLNFFLVLVAAFLLLFFVLLFFLFARPETPVSEGEARAYRIPFSKIEALLRKDPEAHPVKIEALLTAWTKPRFTQIFRSFADRACPALERRAASSFRILFAERAKQPLGLSRMVRGEEVLVNSGLAPGSLASWWEEGHYLSRQVQELDKILSQADTILFTEAGPRSMSVAARSPHIYHFRDAFYLMEGQLKSGRIRKSGFPPAVLETIPGRRDAEFHLLRSGVLLFHPPFLRKDQLWIWVRLRSGNQYIFIGNDWPETSCLLQAKAPVRLWFLERGLNAQRFFRVSEALKQIRARYARSKKGIYIINGSDLKQIRRYVRRKILIAR